MLSYVHKCYANGAQVMPDVAWDMLFLFGPNYRDAMNAAFEWFTDPATPFKGRVGAPGFPPVEIEWHGLASVAGVAKMTCIDDGSRWGKQAGGTEVLSLFLPGIDMDVERAAVAAARTTLDARNEPWTDTVFAEVAAVGRPAVVTFTTSPDGAHIPPIDETIWGMAMVFLLHVAAARRSPRGAPPAGGQQQV